MRSWPSITATRCKALMRRFSPAVCPALGRHRRDRRRGSGQARRRSEQPACRRRTRRRLTSPPGRAKSSGQDVAGWLPPGVVAAGGGWTWRLEPCRAISSRPLATGRGAGCPYHQPKGETGGPRGGHRSTPAGHPTELRLLVGSCGARGRWHARRLGSVGRSTDQPKPSARSSIDAPE